LGEVWRGKGKKGRKKEEKIEQIKNENKK